MTFFVYNHDIPDSVIHIEDVEIKLKGIVPAGPLSILRVDSENSNPKQTWIDLGSPEYPTREELSRIEEASRNVPAVLKSEPTSDGCTLHFSIPPHGVAALTLPL
jgi:xylan 1,4-beta-xylosidase